MVIDPQILRNVSSGGEDVFVGVHVRRGDYER